MEQNSMTALVSAFARAYHAERVEGEKVFDDFLAARLLTREERENIAPGARGLCGGRAGGGRSPGRGAISASGRGAGQLRPTPAPVGAGAGDL